MLLIRNLVYSVGFIHTKEVHCDVSLLGRELRVNGIVFLMRSASGVIGLE